MAGLSSDELFAKIKGSSDCHSLLKKNLTDSVYADLKDKKSSLGGTLADCIRSGCENTDSHVGLYASDPDAYTAFAPVFDNVIKDYHGIKGDITHPVPTFGDLDNLPFGDLDPEGKYVVSTRVRVGRSHENYSFPPTLEAEKRIEMENKSVEALKTLTGELEGTYYPLKGMTKETQQKLTDDHFLFNNSDRFLKAAGGYNDWPNGRGIFFNKNKTFLVWVNEEDHLRLISMQMGGNLAEVYKRLVNAINTLEKKLSFAKHPKMGYLTFCPTNLGTTMRASVHAKIPKLAAHPDFQKHCDRLNIQARGIHGEHTESVGGVYDLSNKRRLGLSEIEAAKEMADGVIELIKLEKSL